MNAGKIEVENYNIILIAAVVQVIQLMRHHLSLSFHKKLYCRRGNLAEVRRHQDHLQ